MTTLCLPGPLFPSSLGTGVMGMSGHDHGHALTYNEKWTWLYFIFRSILGRSTLPLSLLFSFMVFLTLSAPCSFSPRCLFSLAGSCYVVQQSFKLAIPSLQSPTYSDCWCTVHHTVAGLSEGFCCCHCILFILIRNL